MPTDASAYAALGLEPGADAAAVESAYKRLIKQYHPDRAGGDAGRAAEINRAYRELRFAGGRMHALEINQDEAIRQDRRVLGFVFLAAAIIVVLVLMTGPIRGLGQAYSAPALPRIDTGRSATAAPPADAMDQPLADAAVDEGIRDAHRIARDDGELALANASRECHRRLRLDPDIAQLDRCAAFDDAVVQLQDRDPLRDRGPFSELAVTGRLMSGGTLFSNDYLAIDSRLDRIRLHVALALSPAPLKDLPVNEPEVSED